MIDTEVVRLRSLRNSALRVRAMARALARTRAVHDDPVLNATACAAWRVSRAVSGRLRAHPYASFQRDAGLASIVANEMAATGAAILATSRPRAFRGLARQVRVMARQLEDARAVTWVPDLSDSFGRSLAEFRPLMSRIEKEARSTSSMRPAVLRGQAQATPYATTDTDWPYMAL